MTIITMIVIIIIMIVLFFDFFMFNFAIFGVFYNSREECQSVHVLFISPLKGEVTVKFERFHLAFRG